MDVVEIEYKGQLGACVLPRAEFERLQKTKLSERAIRYKVLAYYRPDVVWLEKGEWQYLHMDYDVNQRHHNVLAGGTGLSQSIAESDKNLTAMRKIVH